MGQSGNSGTGRDDCGKRIDCGPCTCATGCPDCQNCNEATGRCDNVANGTACDDGDACTQTDTCQNGECVGSNPVVCPSSEVCCDGSCCDGCCGDAGSCGSCLVFITSSVHTGALGGLSGADHICQTRADEAERPGTYKAWLSAVGAGGESPSTRFRQSAQPYVLVDDTQVAANWTDLINPPGGEIGAKINVTETGSTFADIQFAWTNTSPDGTPTFQDEEFNCANWTKNFDGGNGGNVLFGTLGRSNTKTTAWTGSPQASSTGFCPEAENGGVGTHLYCFQQD